MWPAVRAGGLGANGPQISGKAPADATPRHTPRGGLRQSRAHTQPRTCALVGYGRTGRVVHGVRIIYGRAIAAMVRAQRARAERRGVKISRPRTQCGDWPPRGPA